MHIVVCGKMQYITQLRINWQLMADLEANGTKLPHPSAADFWQVLDRFVALTPKCNIMNQINTFCSAIGILMARLFFLFFFFRFSLLFCQ